MYPRTGSFESRVLTDITQPIQVQPYTKIESIIFPDAFTLDKKELEVITIHPEDNQLKYSVKSEVNK